MAELKEELSGSSAAIVADYRGLTVSDIGAVRRALRGEGINYRVVKNRLAKIAADEAGREELNELLEGPTGPRDGRDDEVALASAFLDAIRPYQEGRDSRRRGRRRRDRRRRRDAAGHAALARGPARPARRRHGLAAAPTMAALFAAPLRNLGGTPRSSLPQQNAAAGLSRTDPTTKEDSEWRQ